jgi:hypothetical protein
MAQQEYYSHSRTLTFIRRNHKEGHVRRDREVISKSTYPYVRVSLNVCSYCIEK